MLLASAIVGLFAFRVVLTALLFTVANPASWLLGLISAAALCTTALAWMRGVPDMSWRGFGVGLAHCAILTLQPASAPLVGWQVAFWIVVAVQTWTKVSLGARCTVTGPVFVSVEASGLYRFIRHPMTLTECALILCLVGESPAPWNVAALPVIAFTKWAIIRMEESFLMGFPQYASYSRKVRFRLLPGLW